MLCTRAVNPPQPTSFVHRLPAGRLGEPCCRWQTSHGFTYYSCFDKGSYCPRISVYMPPSKQEYWSSEGPPDTTCRPCGKNMDPKYKARFAALLVELGQERRGRSCVAACKRMLSIPLRWRARTHDAPTCCCTPVLLNNALPADSPCLTQYQCNIGGQLALSEEDECEAQQLQNDFESRVKGQAAAPSPAQAPSPPTGA